mmetsp:Transcript_31210/g.48348  ORF Transcript_31210/g.48348 Transcript_31210/m.48348 type:complete len:108 (-) Transcript_31210:432-755(-)
MRHGNLTTLNLLLRGCRCKVLAGLMLNLLLRGRRRLSRHDSQKTSTARDGGVDGSARQSFHPICNKESEDRGADGGGYSSCEEVGLIPTQEGRLEKEESAETGEPPT